MIVVTKCTEFRNEKVISPVIRWSIFLNIGKLYKLKKYRKIEKIRHENKIILRVLLKSKLTSSTVMRV